MARQTKNTPVPTPTNTPPVPPAPKPDPMVGIVMINRQHPKFGEPAGISLEEQMTGIFANAPETLAGVGRLLAIDTDLNTIALAKVRGWSRPTQALLPSRTPDDFKKKGSCAVGIEIVPTSAAGKGLHVDTTTGKFFRLRYCAVVICMQSEVIAALGAPNEARTRKAAAAVTVAVPEQEYAI